MSRRASEGINHAQFLFEEDTVQVVFLKPIPASMAGGNQFGPYEEGREAKVPLWVADVLAENGVAKLKDEDAKIIRSGDLYKLSWKEERNEVLSQLPPHFYPKVRALLRSLDEGIKQNPTHTLLSEQRQSQMKAQDMINCRLQKILRLSMERNPTKSLIDLLSQEERALYTALRSEIEGWRQRILVDESKTRER
ncbi:MAG TPA: DNA replication complex GINS family protein [Candidatus Methanomethylicus sp.]|nr:DNA replication complex GINS family protein [Candidatus Methanomethylicus sp.]HRR54758.1 DNA replication complex GINS family protein [Candidatus Methanomethylicus sp.]